MFFLEMFQPKFILVTPPLWFCLACISLSLVENVFAVSSRWFPPCVCPGRSWLLHQQDGGQLHGGRSQWDTAEDEILQFRAQVPDRRTQQGLPRWAGEAEEGHFLVLSGTSWYFLGGFRSSLHLKKTGCFVEHFCSANSRNTVEWRVHTVGAQVILICWSFLCLYWPGQWRIIVFWTLLHLWCTVLYCSPPFPHI